MKISEVLDHTPADDKHLSQVLQSLWTRHSNPEWQATWPFRKIMEIGQAEPEGLRPVQVLGPWPPGLRSIYFFVQDGNPIGFVRLHKGGRDGDYQNDPRYGVTLIYILPQYRRQGIGRAFYDFLQSHIGLIPDSKQSAGGEALWKNREMAQPSRKGGTPARLPAGTS